MIADMIRGYQKGDGQLVLVQAEQNKEAIFAEEFDRLYAYTLADKEGVYAVFGWRFGEEKETAECFALVSKTIGNRLIEIVKFLRQQIPFLMKKYQVKRVIMTVKKNFIAGERLARLIGFSYASDLPRFFLDEDYQLFERINK